MKLLTRMFLLFLMAFVLVTAAYAEHSDTDIAYPVTGGNIYFDKATGTITDCDSKVTEAIIPAQIAGIEVTSIGDNSFAWCTNLTNVEFPDSITFIGISAFEYCDGLINIEFPHKLTSIGDSAFSCCATLNSVEIPDSVISIGKGAFSDCSCLTNISVASDNENYSSLDGALFNKNQTIIMGYPAGRINSFYNIPDSVTSIGDSAFSGCRNLTSVKIPDSVTSIGDSAFFFCTNLKNAEIGNRVTLVGYMAFYKCFNLTNVKIPKSVTSIDANAFWGCTGLTSVEIPRSVNFIGYYAFGGVPELLRDIYYGGSKEQWEAIDGISDSRLISDNVTVHYNVSMPETPPPEFTVPSAPTVGGHAISAADLSALMEISVPLTVSADFAVSVTICAPFFDGGKFLGMGYVTATVDKTTQSVGIHHEIKDKALKLKS